MYDDEQEDTRQYQVVVNHEEQYSIWFADRELPLGWKAVGFSGTKQECLDYIEEEVWTDMRPLSLRKKMEENARRAAAASSQAETAPAEKAKGAKKQGVKKPAAKAKSGSKGKKKTKSK